MKRQTSDLISERSNHSSTSMSTPLTTGKGEVALVTSNSKRYLLSTLRPNTGRRFTPVSYIQPQSTYQQPVQRITTIENKHTPAKEGSGGRYRFIKSLFLILFGMILCGIPLAVISTLYVQQRASSSSTNDQSTTATVNMPTTSVTLPSQCSSYTTNNDSTRNIASGPGSLCDNTLTTGWYRFMGGAGRYLATNHVSRDTCTTYFGGSYNGSLPSTVGETTYGTLCLNRDGYLCYAPWSGSVIGVTNCSSYYVYYLTPMTNCNARYCTTF